MGCGLATGRFALGRCSGRSRWVKGSGMARDPGCEPMGRLAGPVDKRLSPESGLCRTHLRPICNYEFRASRFLRG